MVLFTINQEIFIMPSGMIHQAQPVFAEKEPAPESSDLL